MYTPPHFREDDTTLLHDLIEQYSFGLLVGQQAGVPVATHLPFLLDRTSGTYGALTGHMARANPAWEVSSSEQVLAIFSGPHAYVSPSWYEAKNAVPTWNYIAIHATGRFELIDDLARKRTIVAQSVKHYESTMERPWLLENDSHYAEKLLDHIVGFRITIEQLEGKLKLSQNHPVERRRKVIAALQKQDQQNRDDNARDVAKWMSRILPQ